MGKATARKIGQDVVAVEQPRRPVLPQDIVHMIMEMFGTDRETLTACSLAIREFTFAALCRLGRHVMINTVPRLRECASLINEGSAFQHVRSLDLGITTKKVIRERDWDDYLIILEAFGRRRTLTCLWLTEVPFRLSKPGKQEALRSAVTSLAATVNELGLYSCHFSCYAEMISLVRAFPLCTSLYVRDCIGRKTPGADIFAGLLQHTLHISDLELTSSSHHKFLIDVSNLIKDAALDISSLVGFLCDMGTESVARHTVMTAAASPIERLQLICDEAEGYHVLADPAVTMWPLKSLTIGPLVQKDKSWCERALELNPHLPCLESINILGRYKKPVRYRDRLWGRIDRLLSPNNTFPRLKQVNICITIGSRRLRYLEQRDVARCLPKLYGAGMVYFWGEKGDF